MKVIYTTTAINDRGNKIHLFSASLSEALGDAQALCKIPGYRDIEYGKVADAIKFPPRSPNV